MNQITPFDGNILVPLQVVKLKFYEKEEVSLNPFQTLILAAIEEDCSVEQIAQATLLTGHVIKSEITQLTAQKLLVQQGDLFELSELSRKILYVSRCVQRLNEEEKHVSINLVTGDIEPYDEECFVENDASGLILQPGIRKQEIDGISVEENIEFFKAYFSSIDDMEDEMVDMVLSSVYVEFLVIGEKRFRAQPVSWLPCLIGEEIAEFAEDGNSPVRIYAGGKLCRIQFSVHLNLPGADGVLLSQLLPKLADSGYLSEKGLRNAKVLETLQREPPAVYYDCVSGCWQLDKPQFDTSRPGVDLQLPIRHELSEKILTEIAEFVRQSFSIPEELILEADENREDYIVEALYRRETYA